MKIKNIIIEVDEGVLEPFDTFACIETNQIFFVDGDCKLVPLFTEKRVDVGVNDELIHVGGLFKDENL